MSDAMDAVIRELAAKHGVLLGRDDPIVMLTTIQGVMLRELQEQQAQSLAAFQSEMERFLSSWTDDSKGKAERIVNGALDVSKRIMAQNTEALCDALVKTFDKKSAELEARLMELNSQRRDGFRILSVFCGVALLVAVAGFLF